MERGSCWRLFPAAQQPHQLHHQSDEAQCDHQHGAVDENELKKSLPLPAANKLPLHAWWTNHWSTPLFPKAGCSGCLEQGPTEAEAISSSPARTALSSRLTPGPLFLLSREIEGPTGTPQVKNFTPETWRVVFDQARRETAARFAECQLDFANRELFLHPAQVNSLRSAFVRALAAGTSQRGF